ncbi:hypothetical protein GDO78_017597, partial [Eleutherodactylus coqui]
MATALCRGWQRGVFRAATFSSITRWTNTKTPPTFSTTNDVLDSYLKKEHGGAEELQDANKPSVCSRTNDIKKGRPERDYNQQYSKQDKKETIRPRVKKLIKRLPEQSKRFSEVYKKPSGMYDDVESYDTKMDPRGFQQSRPEYKSLCYNFQTTMEICLEEGKTLLQKVACNDDLAPAEIPNFLEKLSCLPEDHINRLTSSEEFTKLCSSNIKSLHVYTHEDLIRVLAAFVRLNVPKEHPILKAYERELSRRVRFLSTNELLLVADMFRCLSFRTDRFVDTMYIYMDLCCMDLSLSQAVQLIYLIGEKRYAPEDLMRKLEAVVLRDVQTITLDEIGTVCLGFFKSGHGLSPHLMRTFGDMIMENSDNISNFSLVSVLKMFRFTRVNHIDFFRQIGQEAHKRIPNMGIQGIMHVTLCFSSFRILNENLMNAVASVIPDRVSYCRSKDIAKLLWSFGRLNYDPPNADIFYSALITEISKNLEEFLDFPEHFLTCLMGLAFCQRFPLDLIEVALSEEFIRSSLKRTMFELKKDLFTIAGSVEIECPEYTGENISPELRQEVTQMLVSFSKQDIHIREEELNAVSTLEILLGGPEFVKYHMILPHTRSKDVEVHLDINNKPIALNSNIAQAKQSKEGLVAVQVTDDLIGQLLNKSLNQTPEDAHNGLKASPKPKSSAKITEGLLTQLTNKKPATEITKLALQ